MTRLCWTSAEVTLRTVYVWYASWDVATDSATQPTVT